MTEWTWRLRATVDDGKVTKMVVEDEQGPLEKDWEKWDAEHPYEPHPRVANEVAGSQHDEHGTPVDPHGSGGAPNRSEVFDSVEHARAAGYTDGPYYHGTTTGAAETIKNEGLAKGTPAREIPGAHGRVAPERGAYVAPDRETAKDYAGIASRYSKDDATTVTVMAKPGTDIGAGQGTPVGHLAVVRNG